MRILSIGDTHGNAILDEVKKLINDFDKVIFMGDYVDSFSLTDLVINSNLNDLIVFARENKDKVILLYGNHK